jgi:hypothetical protein
VARLIQLVQLARLNTLVVKGGVFNVVLSVDILIVFIL